MEEFLIRGCYVTYDRYVWFKSKQQRGEWVKSYHEKLNEQLSKCKLGEEEDMINRDISITKMIDFDTLKELLNETVVCIKYWQFL